MREVAIALIHPSPEELTRWAEPVTQEGHKGGLGWAQGWAQGGPGWAEPETQGGAQGWSQRHL